MSKWNGMWFFVYHFLYNLNRFTMGNQPSTQETRVLEFTNMKKTDGEVTITMKLSEFEKWAKVANPQQEKKPTTEAPFTPQVPRDVVIDIPTDSKQVSMTHSCNLLFMVLLAILFGVGWLIRGVLFGWFYTKSSKDDEEHQKRVYLSFTWFFFLVITVVSCLFHYGILLDIGFILITVCFGVCWLFVTVSCFCSEIGIYCILGISNFFTILTCCCYVEREKETWEDNKIKGVFLLTFAYWMSLMIGFGAGFNISFLWIIGVSGFVIDLFVMCCYLWDDDSSKVRPL